MLFEAISFIIVIIALYLVYTQYQNKENFSILYPFYNEYHPYANPFSECIEDAYNNMRCYDPVYSSKYLPYYYKYPTRYRNIYNRYRKIK